MILRDWLRLDCLSFRLVDNSEVKNGLELSEDAVVAYHILVVHQELVVPVQRACDTVTSLDRDEVLQADVDVREVLILSLVTLVKLNHNC